MQGLNEFKTWRQRHEELLREAEMNRLAKAVRSGRKRRSRPFPALGWELRRYGGRLSNLLRALRQFNTKCHTQGEK